MCFVFNFIQLKNFSRNETSPLPAKYYKYWPILGIPEGSLSCFKCYIVPILTTWVCRKPGIVPRSPQLSYTGTWCHFSRIENIFPTYMKKNNSLFCIERGLFITRRINIVWCQRGAVTTWFVATGDQTPIFTNAWKALYQTSQRGRPVSWCTKPQKVRPRIKVSHIVLYYVSLEKLFSLGLCFVLLALK